MKKRYISPATNIIDVCELEHSILVGSVLQVEMRVDPLQEEGKYYKWDNQPSDYLIEL